MRAQTPMERRCLALRSCRVLRRARRVACRAVTGLALLSFALSAPTHLIWLTALSQPFVADPQAVRAGLAHFGLSVQVYATYQLALAGLFALGSYLTASLIVVRKAAEPMALYVAFMLVLLGTALPFTIDALLPFFTPADLLLKACSVGAWLLFYSFFYLFPDGRFVPGWPRWLLLLLAVREVARFFLPDSPLSPMQWAPPLRVADALLSAATCLGAQVYRYRRVASAAQRQQTKWVLFGLTVALIGLFVFAVPTLFLPGQVHLGPLFDLSGAGIVAVTFLALPITLTLAMLRARLWEIDVVINRALVYSGLMGILGLAYGGSVLLLLWLFHDLTGVRDGLALSGATVLIALLFQPLRARLQELIDRRFYRDKYDAAQTLASFSAQLRDEVALEHLTAELVAVVEATMQPAHVSLWLRPPTAWAAQESTD